MSDLTQRLRAQAKYVYGERSRHTSRTYDLLNEAADALDAAERDYAAWQEAANMWKVAAVAAEARERELREALERLCWEFGRHSAILDPDSFVSEMEAIARAALARVGEETG